MLLNFKQNSSTEEKKTPATYNAIVESAALLKILTKGSS